MRTIKFRGRRPEGGYMYGGINETGNGIIVNNLPIFVEPESVAQFTGMTDKHGNEIYEGDVLQFDEGGKHYEYTVRFQAFAVADDGCYLTAKQFKDKELKPNGRDD